MKRENTIEQDYNEIVHNKPQRSYISPEDEGFKIKKFSLLKDIPVKYSYQSANPIMDN